MVLKLVDRMITKSAPCRRIRCAEVVCAALALAACGGGGGYGGGGGGGGGATTYTVGGMVSGLAGSGLVLRDNGGDDLAVSMSGSFAFATKLATNAAYSVTVKTQPTGPTQSCVVSNGSGTVGTSNVTSVAVACGTVSGPYKAASYSSSGDTGDLITVTFDGAGSFNGSAVENKNGTISNITISGTYAVAADGTLTITNTNGDVSSGGVSANGNTVVLSQTTATKNPSIAVGIKEGQTNFTNANLMGTYKAVSYSNSGDTGDLATLTFDGAGNFNGTAVENTAGMISNMTPSGTYSVAADGSLTVTFNLGPTNSGGVSADGNTFVLSKTIAGQTPGIAVGVKQGQSNFTNASVKAIYTIAGYVNSGDGSDLITVTLDGAGKYSGTEVDNKAGTISSVAASGTYTVASDGTSMVTPAGGSALSGGVSADGNTIVLFQTTAGQLPGIQVGIHR